MNPPNKSMKHDKKGVNYYGSNENYPRKAEI